MSDPQREALLEKLLIAERRAIIVNPDGAGGICFLLPGCVQITLPREEALALAQEITNAVESGTQHWDGWSS